jgi:hypothetical protein
LSFIRTADLGYNRHNLLEASTAGIVSLLSLQFLLLVTVANLIA